MNNGGEDVPSHIYKRDVVDKWHGEKGLYVSYEEMGIPQITPDGKVHGNSKQSTNEQHKYEIYEKATNDVVKTGLSGQPLNKDGSSPRANAQVNALNKECGYPKYDSIVNITGIPDRVQDYRKKVRMHCV